VTRLENIRLLRQTAASHRRVGNDFMADLMEGKALTMEAQSDQEYNQAQQGRKPNPAQEATLRAIARSVMGRSAR
jgi:hypothetical protein